MDEFLSVIPPIRAAEYLRMSTADQHHSIPHQQSIIREYATHHGMVVVRSYADEGKSGLTLNRREALAQLLTAVQDGSADFQVILVYDVSRWGRFQDVDESAYYEYLCRRSNVHVEYCAEPFVGQTGPLANILKSIKRAMAAEFSREHATKIAFAKRRAAMQGYFTGGPPDTPCVVWWLARMARTSKSSSAALTRFFGTIERYLFPARNTRSRWSGEFIRSTLSGI